MKSLLLAAVLVFGGTSIDARAEPQGDTPDEVTPLPPDEMVPVEEGGDEQSLPASGDEHVTVTLAEGGGWAVFGTPEDAIPARLTFTYRQVEEMPGKPGKPKKRKRRVKLQEVPHSVEFVLPAESARP